MLRHNTTSHLFSYHPKFDKLNITYLAFADYLMLFCKGDANSVRIFMQSLDLFHSVSGLQINAGKSKLFVVGLSNETL